MLPIGNVRNAVVCRTTSIRYTGKSVVLEQNTKLGAKSVVKPKTDAPVRQFPKVIKNLYGLAGGEASLSGGIP